MQQEKKIKILIAEDDISMGNILASKITREGYEVKIANDGQITLDFLEKEKFDLILLDLMMPVKDGFMVMNEMEKRGDKTPIIVSTNLNQTEDVARAIALGAKDYFIKSETPISEVIKHIKEFSSFV